MEQGPESQRASCVGSGGVSAVIGASDLVAISVAALADQGNQFNRALQPSGQVAETEVNVPEADRRRRRILGRVGGRQ